MKWKKVLPLIGVILFIYILLKINLTNIFNEISNANPTFILVAIIFVFLSLVTQTLKWFIITRTQKIPVPFKDAFVINLKSIFYGFVTPSKIGNAMRSDYLKSYPNSSFGKGLSNYVVEKVLDLCSLIFIVVIAALAFRELIPRYLFYVAIVGFIILAVLLAVFRSQKRSKTLLRWFYKIFVPKKIKEKVKLAFYSFYRDMPKKSYFIIFFLFNLVNWFTIYVTLYFIGISLGINVSFFYYLAILPVATLVGQIPITVSGLGTREATMISLFGLLGVEAAKVVSMSLIGLFIGGVIPALIGSFLILKNKGN